MPLPPEIRVRCGGLAAHSHRSTSDLILDVGAPPGSPHRVNLDICGLSRQLLANVPERCVDLLEIAVYIYCADQLSRRDTPKMHDLGSAWRRSFHFDIPVRDPSFWSRREVMAALVETLGFLSDDAYAFSFRAPAKPAPTMERYLDLDWPEATSSSNVSSGRNFGRVIMFSGGLDSFAGAAETLLSNAERAVLVSHRAAPLVQSRQAALVDVLRQRTRPGSLIHVGVNVNKGPEEAREFTQRSRSFLFAALGFVVARTFRCSEVLFFENGIVSLNLPVAQHVLGARATRTTHPRVLTGFAGLFSLVADESVRVANPYLWRTKAEVLEQIAAAGLAAEIAATFSCARVREAAQLGGRHCGVCSQCLDRRFGVLAAGLEVHDPAEGYAVDLFTGARSPGVDTIMAESFVITALKWRDASEMTFLSRYGEVFRVLPFLDGDLRQNVSRIHDLHRRHGMAVGRVLDDALRAHSSLAAMDRLPDSSLLALVRAPHTPPPVLVDRAAETDPSAARQAEASGRPELHRPIRIAIDHENRRLLFAAGFSLRGRSFDLISGLARAFRDDQAANLAPDQYRFRSWSNLAAELGQGEGALRKAIARLQRAIIDGFRENAGVEIGRDEVVQNRNWQGYRLNPHLIIQPPAVLAESVDQRPAQEADGGDQAVKCPVSGADVPTFATQLVRARI